MFSAFGIVDSIEKDEDLTLPEFRSYCGQFVDEYLEDVAWFVEHVLSVEEEMKERWAESVRKWQRSASFLHDKGLLACAALCQEEKVARWMKSRAAQRGDEVCTFFSAPLSSLCFPCKSQS